MALNYWRPDVESLARASPGDAAARAALLDGAGAALDCSGHERGVGFAAGMAESSLLGLVSATARPIAHAQAFGLGRRWRRSEVIWRSLGASA